MLGNVYTKEFDIMKLHGNVYKEQSVLCYGLKWVFFSKRNLCVFETSVTKK